MKTLIAALAAVAAVTATAAPAAAQPYGYDRHDGYDRRGDYDRGDRYDRGRDNIDARQADLWRRMEQAHRRGLLTRAEYSKVRNGFDTLAQAEARMRVDGLNRWERTELNRRLNLLEESLEWRIANADTARGYYARR
jgi:hypothetical protein